MMKALISKDMISKLDKILGYVFLFYCVVLFWRVTVNELPFFFYNDLYHPMAVFVPVEQRICGGLCIFWAICVSM